MEVKEAIEFLEHYRKLYYDTSLYADIDEVIVLLQQGEKYRLKKTITIEIKAKNEIDMNWFSDRFKSFKEQIVVDLPYTKIETKEGV